jgi:hypothetical protein
MSKLIKEVNEIIAVRVPPGDRWILINDTRKIIHPSITEALESYFKETKIKCEYRLAPLDSKLYAIKTIEEEVVPQPPKGFNIYGDPV